MKRKPVTKKKEKKEKGKKETTMILFPEYNN